MLRFAPSGLVLAAVLSGADLGFSRGGGADFQKIFTPFDFPSSPKALKRRCYGQIFCAADNFFEKTGQKAVFGALFGKLDKKIACFLARAPPQN